MYDLNKPVHQLETANFAFKRKIVTKLSVWKCEYSKVPKSIENLFYFLYCRCEGKVVFVFNHHNMDMYGEMKVKFHAFSSSEVGRGE